MTFHASKSASSAARFMACPGSFSISPHGGGEKEDSAFADEGTAAHDVASFCLNTGWSAWTAIGRAFYKGIVCTPAMASAVQVYLDYVRGFGYDNLVVETTLKDPELGDDFGGTADCYATGLGFMHVFDYKHGEGIAVDIDDNEQLKYYAFLVLRKLRREGIANVGMTIVQPRAFHPDGPIREVWMKAEDIIAWGNDVLVPAMAAADQPGAPLVTGEHCRFCPAKDALTCPATKTLFAALVGLKAEGIEHMTDEQLGQDYGTLSVARMHMKALEAAAFKRNSEGHSVPGTKLVQIKSDRVWKEGIDASALGPEAFTEPTLKSPAQVEKLGPEGRDFVAANAFKPDRGLTLASADDKRGGVKAKTAAEVFGNGLS
jgi:hypothetical protein